MRHPRWELAGRRTGRGIYQRRWDFKMGTGRQGDGKRNLPQEMGHPRWELAVGKREEEFTT